MPLLVSTLTLLSLSLVNAQSSSTSLSDGSSDSPSFSPYTGSVPSATSDPVSSTDIINSTSTSISSISTSVASNATSIPSSSLPSSTSTTSSFIPSQSADPAALNDMETIFERRVSYIARGMSNLSSIPAWISTLGADGAWPANEVDYTSGCTAQRANWPIQQHWIRISKMAAAWHGGVPESEGDAYTKDPKILDAVHRGMDYWYANLYNITDCIASGGLPACPCGSGGFWNSNWFSNLILIPRFVGQTCLLVNETLSDSQRAGCTTVLTRTFNQLDNNINGVGYLTGANTLDTSSIAIDLGLFNRNLSVVQDGYRRIHKEVAIQDAVAADGIRRDGSFGQHGGVLYNGNYGKDYANAVLSVEVNAGGTQFTAANSSRVAFASLLDGGQWMIYRNKLTGVLHWDFSALGRFISFAVSDAQATGSININVTDVGVLGQLWNSEPLKDFANTLQQNTSSANVGDVRGNRMFYNNDYMVQRGPGYITTVKMFSPRTKNTECLNSQNPLGFHLSDGVVHTYLKGNEYEDIAASWDWNLIPGTTVDYGATPLTCDKASWMGIEPFVGGVSTRQAGLSAMRYTNPYTKALSWQKAWFFLENDIQVVVLSDLSSTSSDLSNVVSVLDQRRKEGPYYVDGIVQHGHNLSHFPLVTSLWHGGVGYTFDFWSPLSLSVETGPKTGNWSLLGISAEPPTTVDLFAAWIDHPISNTLAYSVYPGTTHKPFRTKALKSAFDHKVIHNDKHVSAVLDEAHDKALIVFWDSNGGALSIPASLSNGRSGVSVTADANSAVIYDIRRGNITVSDPSQSNPSLTLMLKAHGFGQKPKGFSSHSLRNVTFQLPSGGLAGSGVSQAL